MFIHNMSPHRIPPISTMLARLLAASSKHDEAISNLVSLLEQRLNETIPRKPSRDAMKRNILEVKPVLMNLTVDQMKSLPTMKDTAKLRAMELLSLLCTISISSPILLPLFSLRMVELTIQFGFCNESILGVFFASYSVVRLSDM